MSPAKSHASQQRPGSKLQLHSWLHKHGRIATTSAERILANPVSSAMTILVIAVSLLLPALLFALNNNLTTLLDGFQKDAKITLFLSDTINDEELFNVSEDLLLLDGVDAIETISRAQALAEFSTASGLGSILDALPANPLPATILITPVGTEITQIQALARILNERPEVLAVQLDSEWLLRLEAISKLISVLGTGLSLVVVLGLFVVVGNTIKLAIENRKQEIIVVKLVGGTDAFIARPFLYTGAWYGASGGLLAALLYQVLMLTLSGSLQQLLTLYDSSFQLQGLGLLGSLCLVLAGAGIGWAAALIASLRHILAINP